MKAIKALILSLALVMLPAGVTADHKTFAFDLPHDVASDLAQFALHAAGPGQYYVVAGCDIVWTLPLHGLNETLVGYAMHAQNSDGKDRLVAIELWNRMTKEKFFSYVATDDYGKLKKCHDAAKGQLGV